MTAVLVAKTILDANGAAFPVQMIDLSGVGSGPFLPAHFTMPGTVVERSGSITAGGTSQQLAPANTVRRRLIVVNPGINTVEPLFIRFGASNPAGVQDGYSIAIKAGASWDSGSGPCPSDQVNVTAATTGHQFTAIEI